MLSADLLTVLVGLVLGLGALLVVQAVYVTYLEFRVRRLRRRGAYPRAIRLARRVVWFLRLNFRGTRWVGALVRNRRGEEGTIFSGYVRAVCDLAGLLQETGEIGEAEELLDGALEQVREVGAESTQVHALLLNGRAALDLYRGAVAAARPLMEQALAIQRAVASDKPEIGQTLANLGVVYYRLGDYPAAARAYEEALTVNARFARLAQEPIGVVLTNLGGLYADTGELGRAGELLRQAVEHVRSVLGERHPRSTTAVLNLAHWHNRMRQYPEAIRLLRECVRIRAEVPGTDSPEYAHALNNLAVNLLESGDRDAARPLADEALAGRLGFGEDHPLATHALGTRALIDVADSRPADALARWRESARLERRTIGRVFSVASDAQRLAYLASVRKRLFYFLSLVRTHLPGDPEAVAAAFELVLTRKALAAEATAARRDAVLGGRYPHLADKFRELTAISQRIAAEAIGGRGNDSPATHQRILAGLLDRQAALEFELARSIPEVGLEQRLLAADRYAVAAALPAGSALVEFIRFDLFDFLAVPGRGEEPWKPARYLAFVLRSEDPGAVRMIDLGEADAIDGGVRAFRADLLGGGTAGSRGMALLDDQPAAEGPAGPGVGLRERVFDPLRDAVAGAGQLVLATDGELAVLPFEVLPGPDGRPLVEDYRFSYLAVGRDVLRAETRYGEQGQPLVFAGPDFDLGSGKVAAETPPVPDGLSRDLDRSSLRFPPLPGTLSEGREVAGLLGVEPAVGPEAVEARLKAAAAPRVLHVATHGFFLPDQRADPDGGFRGAAPENPLLRSGLALAGANTWLAGGTPPADAGDGLITAEDVTGLDLLGTELVVLSACETGLGEVRAGEGVFGLRRAFQLAGARTVVMSLWKVPDEATRQLMASFYEHLLAGLPRAEALRRAQLELKARYPDPRYWGAFILQGEAGPLQPTAEPGIALVADARPALPPAPAASAPALAGYDVADDLSVPWPGALNVLAVAGLLVFAVIVAVRQLDKGQPPADVLGKMAIVLAVSPAIAALVYWVTISWLLDQRRCKRWRREGDFQTVEGVVSGCQSRTDRSPYTGPFVAVLVFQIAGRWFTLRAHPRRGGFRLEGLPGVGDPASFIRDGVPLRVGYHEDRILRIEVLTGAAPAESLQPPDAVPAASPADGASGRETRLPDVPPGGVLVLRPGRELLQPLLVLAACLGAGGAVVLVAGGSWLLAVSPLGLAVAMLVLGAWWRTSPRMALTLTADGFAYGNLRRRWAYRWSDVAGFGVYQRGEFRQACFRLKPVGGEGQAAPDGAPGLDRYFHQTYGRSGDELVGLLESWRVRHTATGPDGPSGPRIPPAGEAGSPAGPEGSEPGRWGGYTRRGLALRLILITALGAVLPLPTIGPFGVIGGWDPGLLRLWLLLGFGFAVTIAAATFAVDFVIWWNRPPDRAEPAPGLVYDVLDDRPIRAVDFFFLGFYAVGVVLTLVCTVAFTAVPPQGWSWYHGPLFGIGLLLLWAVTSLMYLQFAIRFARDQARCMAWRRSGEYTTTEGTVSGYEKRSSGGRGWFTVTFRVGGEAFALESNSARGGFRLESPQGAEDTEFLADGVRLRVMHRDGRFLRIEVLGFGGPGIPMPPGPPLPAAPDPPTPPTD
jgi:tetratricopeptide (TPR) repeat protein